MHEDQRYNPAQRPQGPRRELLERAPAGGTVLDVGCWSGFLGEHLIEHRSATVDGVEPDRAMAARAARTYRRVLPMTIEDALAELRAAEAGYDAFVLFDVLEHLADPWSVLRGLRDIGAPGARALVSIPNVAHWSVRKSLLRGRWEYEDSGLLDRTHLRFFTFDGAAELLEQSGWRITWRGASPGQPPLVRLPPRALGVLGRWPRMFGVQTLLEAEMA